MAQCLPRPSAEVFRTSNPIYDGLRSYQIAEVLKAHEPARGLYWEPRLGKSRAIARIELRWLHELGLRKNFIVGPLTPLSITWMRELEKLNYPGEIIPLLSAPSNRAKGEWVAERLRSLENRREPFIVLINDDILEREYAGPRGGRHTISDLICRIGPDSVVRDEAHRDSTAGAARSQALRRIGRYSKFRRSLTGTPDPNGRINLYSQFVFLDPEIFGTNKTAFLEKYVIAADRYYREIIGYKNLDEFDAKVLSRVSIVRAEDYFDVPPKEEITRSIPLTGKARELYDALKRDKVLVNDEFEIDATHQLAMLTRLQQLTTGYLPVDDPETQDVRWIHDEKINSVISDLAEPLAAGQRVVVSHRWRPEGERLSRELRRRYGDSVVVELNGRTTRDRRELIAPFDYDAPDTGSPARILVSQEKTGGVGISNARADHLHFLNHSFDYGDVEQMMRRIWHTEKKRWTITRHTMPGTVDVFADAVIDRKANATIMLKGVGFDAAILGSFKL